MQRAIAGLRRLAPAPLPSVRTAYIRVDGVSDEEADKPAFVPGFLVKALESLVALH